MALRRVHHDGGYSDSGEALCSSRIFWSLGSGFVHIHKRTSNSTLSALPGVTSESPPDVATEGE